MGKTRRRVTLLVLSLEGLGLVILALALYLAGELRLDCRRPEGGREVECEATERRFFGLVTFQTRRYGRVTGAGTETPALARWEHWLVLETETGPRRVLAGTQGRTAADAGRLERFLAGEGEESELILRRSAAPFALATAVFACLWILVISLIMREFLGYHTPWWWRALGRR